MPAAARLWRGHRPLGVQNGHACALVMATVVDRQRWG